MKICKCWVWNGAKNENLVDLKNAATWKLIRPVQKRKRFWFAAQKTFLSVLLVSHFRRRYGVSRCSKMLMCRDSKMFMSRVEIENGRGGSPCFILSTKSENSRIVSKMYGSSKTIRKPLLEIWRVPSVRWFLIVWGRFSASQKQESENQKILPEKIGVDIAKNEPSEILKFGSRPTTRRRPCSPALLTWNLNETFSSLSSA